MTFNDDTKDSKDCIKMEIQNQGIHGGWFEGYYAVVRSGSEEEVGDGIRMNAAVSKLFQPPPIIFQSQTQSIC